MNKEKLIRDKKKTIADYEVFESPKFAKTMQDTLLYMTKSSKYRVSLTNDPAITGKTDGLQVTIGWRSAITAFLPNIKLKIKSVYGVLFHEIGHILYTDFDTYNEYHYKILNDGILDVDVDNVAAKAEVEEFLQKRPTFRKYIASLIFHCCNILEDYWVEIRICIDFPGTAKLCIVLNRKTGIDNSEPLKQMIDKGYPNLAIVLNLLLDYTFNGKILNPQNLQTEHTDILNNSIFYIDRGRYTPNTWERISNATDIFLNIWPLIKRTIQEKEEEMKDAQLVDGDSENGKKADQLEEAILSEMNKDTEKIKTSSENKLSNSSTSSSYQGSKSKKEKTTNRKKEKKSKNDSSSCVPTSNDSATCSSSADTSKSDSSSAESNSTSSNQAGEAPEVNAPMSSNQAEDTMENSMSTESTSMESSPMSNNKSGRAPTGEAPMDNIPENGMSESGEPDALIDKYINDSFDEPVKEKVEESMFSQSIRSIEEEANSLNCNDIHKGVPLHINRHPKIYDYQVNDYNYLVKSKGLLATSKQLQRNLKAILEKKPSGKNHKQWMGKGIDTSNLYDRQKRFFYKKNIPSETDLAVSVLVDESGSMDGTKIDTAKNMAIILEDFCRSFNIPVNICGHKTHGGDVECNVYTDFDDIDGKDRYRLMNIDSGGANRDGLAILFAGEHLAKRPESKKLLIIISDGSPYHGSYYGDTAYIDIKNIKKKLKAKGVEIFAAAIDEDKEFIKEIYGNGFLDITDLKELPKKMVRLIERFMNV